MPGIFVNYRRSFLQQPNPGHTDRRHAYLVEA